MNLFDDFPPISADEWLQQIEKDLKGKPLTSLLWQPEPLLSIEPWATASDSPPILTENLAPIRGNLFHTFDKGWQIVERANTKMDLIENNDNPSAAISLHIPQNLSEWNEYLHHFQINKIAYHLESPTIPLLFSENISKIFEANQQIPAFFTGTFTLTDTHEKYHSHFADEIKIAHSLFPHFKMIGITAQKWANSMVWQVAIAIAEMVEYIEALKTNVPLSVIFSKFSVKFPIGGNFFPEIAKIRAFRLLFMRIAEIYNLPSPENFPVFILSENSSHNKTQYDAYTNLLRLTTEAMAAILGGTNALIIPPHDVNITDAPSDFSKRIATNIHHLLKYEAHLDKVTDAIGGSYYIEKITYQIAEKAWNTFQMIEEKGGFSACTANGFFQTTLQEINDKVSDEVAHRKKTIIGINNYPNIGEVLPPILIDYQRISQPLEALRKRMDAHTNLTGKRPTIHLLTFGDANIRNIRALFARNLLGCGGFDISEGENMSNTADAVVLCSSDMEYFTHKESIILPLIQEHKIIILAGKPKGWEDLEVNMAIYAGMDIVQCINSLYSYMNIQ